MRLLRHRPSVAAILLAIALAGCEEGDGDALSRRTPTVQPPTAGSPDTGLLTPSGTVVGTRPAPTSTEIPGVQGLTITEEDSGSSFVFTPQTRATLRLTDRYVWSPPQVGGSGAVRLIRVNQEPDAASSEWLIEPVTRGAAVITSVGEPNCAAAAPCPDAPLRFEIRITLVQ